MNARGADLLSRGLSAAAGLFVLIVPDHAVDGSEGHVHRYDVAALE